MRSVVDLPQPDGPTRTTNSRSLIARSISLTAVTGPYALCSLLRTTSAMISDLQPADHVSLSKQRDEQRRHERDHGRRAHEVPLHAQLVHELRHHHGEDRRLVRGEDKSEQKLVPGIKPTQYGKRGQARDGGRQRHAEKRAP